MSKKHSPASWGVGQPYYSQPVNTKLPENYAIRDGFLYKGNSPASLVNSGVVEAASQGFLHVDEAADYETV